MVAGGQDEGDGLVPVAQENIMIIEAEMCALFHNSNLFSISNFLTLSCMGDFQIHIKVL